MTSQHSQSREIDGKGKTIRELLTAKRYSIDYYQREYKWQTKQISELLDDLATKFLDSYKPEHERAAVERYGHYFLGSIIISDKDGQKFIIDGQQRLTTLTLLLIHLHHLLQEPEHKGQIAELIFSQRFGTKSFNLEVPERNACMEAIFNDEPLDETGQPESVQNILARYSDIEDQFPKELTEHALPFFADWLIENVHLVEITAYSDDDAYTIFETMNDRGLSLSPTDMLKGYLLANITETQDRNPASNIWKSQVQKLQEIGKEEDADAIKSWLRSQHAESIRERKVGAVPLDFDLIGTEFHRWVRDNEDRLSLNASSDFRNFIEKDFAFYANQYRRIRLAADTLTAGLECVHYNAQQNLTLQYPVLLAPLLKDDSEAIIIKKLRITASFLDILTARRIWNFRAIDYSSIQYSMFIVMRDIRGKNPEDLVATLRDKLAAEDETFTSNDRFHLHGMNGRQIRRLLARMTDHVEVSSGLQSRYSEYVKTGKNKYEIEHIWAAHPERHTNEFSHPTDFEEYRNRIGGLLLLPKSFNASYGDLPYEQKLEHYFGQNLLAKSLHPKCYEHNPGFLRYLEQSGLPFRPYEHFAKSDLDERQEFYKKLAEEIWNPNRLQRDLIS
ncbi:MAG: hypothetical protein QOE77_3035 [Blastocatellia bacterium]|jgi:uncharacterized protein with ParB-like and HNH nuclease domain|nr:hypothetical protein [Blastocatellia bacterium]